MCDVRCDAMIDEINSWNANKLCNAVDAWRRLQIDQELVVVLQVLGLLLGEVGIVLRVRVQAAEKE